MPLLDNESFKSSKFTRSAIPVAIHWSGESFKIHGLGSTHQIATITLPALLEVSDNFTTTFSAFLAIKKQPKKKGVFETFVTGKRYRAHSGSLSMVFSRRKLL